MHRRTLTCLVSLAILIFSDATSAENIMNPEVKGTQAIWRQDAFKIKATADCINKPEVISVHQECSTAWDFTYNDSFIYGDNHTLEVNGKTVVNKEHVNYRHRYSLGYETVAKALAEHSKHVVTLVTLHPFPSNQEPERHSFQLNGFESTLQEIQSLARSNNAPKLKKSKIALLIAWIVGAVFLVGIGVLIKRATVSAASLASHSKNNVAKKLTKARHEHLVNKRVESIRVEEEAQKRHEQNQ